MSAAVISTLSKEALKSNALAFANRWAGKHGEDAEAKSFLDEFFRIFGRERRAVDARFEHAVARDGQGDGFIDLFWPGKLLVEMKSTGRDLKKAADQAFAYIAHLDDPAEVPQWVLVSDFATFVLYDLGEHPDELLNAFKVEKNRKGRLAAQFTLDDIPRHLGAFAFIRDEEQNLFRTEPAVNHKAVKLLGKLHDSLKASGYTGHALERFLVRILFCLFAEDTDIFPWNSFSKFVLGSRRDGADLGERLGKLFQTLDTEKRAASLPAAYADFPYINGGLFRERLDLADLTAAQRIALIDCCRFDWSQISPAVFGSLFQGVMLPVERREKGAHYTSEENIQKVINPLFLDGLKAELAKLAAAAPTKSRDKALRDFHDKVAGLRLLDPACGCGNFLVVAYRELRLLELETLKLLHPADAHGRRQGVLNIGDLVKVSVDQMYGIEIDEFPALIAETALWLTDHQVNMAVSKAFGQNFLRIPLRASATIRHANALRVDWTRLGPLSLHIEADFLRVNLVEEPVARYGRVTVSAKNLTVLKPGESTADAGDMVQPVFDYIFGNPPFIGAKFMTPEQATDRDTVFRGVKNAGLLDFVTCWHRLASDYMLRNPRARTALVSTNSITQGEQVGVLWPNLFNRGIRIDFAHRTFKWTNEASGKAAVHCVIIGFGIGESGSPRRIFDYPELTAKPAEILASNINPYLVDADDAVVINREKPISPDAPAIAIGNKPIDGGHYLFTESEMRSFIEREPGAQKFFRRWLGADEFINGWHRYCLWLGEAAPAELRKLPLVMDRIEAVRKYRSESESAGTRKIATTPTRFHVEKMPAGNSLIIPEVSSERREYIPIGYVGPETLCSNKLRLMPDATPYHFGVMTSKMHMAWTRAVTGRLESRIQYSVGIVYNNYPWPEPDAKQRAAIESAAAGVHAARAAHPTASLADLYDPLAMPADLRKAHDTLDRAVDAAYGYKGDPADAPRVAALFRLYERLAAPLAPAPKPAKSAPKAPARKKAATPKI